MGVPAIRVITTQGLLPELPLWPGGLLQLVGPYPTKPEKETSKQRRVCKILFTNGAAAHDLRKRPSLEDRPVDPAHGSSRHSQTLGEVSPICCQRVVKKV